MRNPLRDHHQNHRGFTLLEMAVSLMILGFLIASGATVYNLYQKTKAISTSRDNMSLVANALDSYLAQYGSYPCPAPAAVPRTDPNYGMPSNCADVSQAPGTCVNGVCIETSERTVQTTLIKKVQEAYPVQIYNESPANVYSALGPPTVFLPTPPTMGNVIVVMISCYNCNIPAAGVGDSLGQNFTRVLSNTTNAPKNFIFIKSQLTAPTSGSYRININATTLGTVYSVGVVEFSGLQTTGTLDSTGRVNIATNGATTTTVPTLAPTAQDNELAVAMILADYPLCIFPTPPCQRGLPLTPSAGWGYLFSSSPGAWGVPYWDNGDHIGDVTDFNFSIIPNAGTPASITWTHNANMARAASIVTLKGVSAPFVPRVRRGVIPFRVLNLPERVSYDGWGSRLNFTLTEQMGVPGKYKPTEGGITIVDSPGGATMIRPPASANYMLFSSGPDRVGAYTYGGAQSAPCTGAGIDTENCNTSTTAPNDKAIYVNAPYSQLFDDYANYSSTIETPIWSLAATNKMNMHDLGFTSIGINNPSPNQRLDVTGAVRTPNQIQANLLCGFISWTDCFASHKIGGLFSDGLGMTCPGGQFMTGIAYGQPVCTPNPAVICPPGEFLFGLGSSTLSCQPITNASCAALSVSICGAPQTLPASAGGTSITLSAGASRQEIYTCNNGTWVPGAQTGVCTCAPSATNVTQLCGTGFTGNQIITSTTTCPAGTVTQTVDTSACVCQPATESRSVPCAGNLTGTIVEQRSNSCPSAVFGAWAPVSNTCACFPQTATRVDPCPVGGGQTTFTRTLSCPSATWTAWVQSGASTCVCNTDTQFRALDCSTIKGPGWIGVINQTRTMSCPGFVWSPWADTTNTCALGPTPTYRWTQTGAPIDGSSPSSLGLPRLGNDCTKIGSGKTGLCFESNPSGGTYKILPCTCQ